jgi:hypothetical protein
MSKDQPEVLPDFPMEESLMLRYKSDHDFPPDVIPRFIVAHHREIKKKGGLPQAWRYGVILEQDSSQALARQRDREIHISVKGYNKSQYISQLRETMSGLFEAYKSEEPDLEYRIDRFGRIPDTHKYRKDELWLGDEEIRNHVARSRDYYDHQTDQEIPLQDTAKDFNMLKTIRIFLASSNELADDRQAFELFIARENKRLVKQGIFLEVELWEDHLETMSLTRLQDEYNKTLKECDLFVMLFFTKVGKYTEEEFDTAFQQFKATEEKPKLLVYFKDAQVSMSQVNRDDAVSLFDFQDKLHKIGHFHSTYTDSNSLHLHLKGQLEKLGWV